MKTNLFLKWGTNIACRYWVYVKFDNYANNYCIYTCIHNAILHSFIVPEVQVDPKVSQYIKEKIEHVNENADKKSSHVKVTKTNYIFYNERAYKNAYFM